MLVIHPNSTCDVCLEGYTASNNVPHSISCGHIFCLRCLQSLSKYCCPFCRTKFDPAEVRKLHIDRTAPSVTDPGQVSDVRRMQDAISRIVLDGASLTQVRNTIDEVHVWLKPHAEDQHRDLRASHRLLYRVTEDRQTLAASQQSNDELRCQLVEAQRLLQDIEEKRRDENEAAFTVERSLREHYTKMNSEWSGKYEVALAECRKLYDEVERLRSDTLPTTSRLFDSHILSSSDNGSYHVDGNKIVKENGDTTMDDLTEALQEDVFKLSPLPSTLPTPIELPLGRGGSAAEETTTTQPYIRQSIPPISIKAPEPHFSGSYLSRHMQERDLGLPRSLPQRYEHGGIHAFMASRQPSPPRPSTSNHGYHDRGDDVVMMSASVSRQSSLREHRHALSNELRGDEEQQDRWRTQLRDLLQHGPATPSSHVSHESEDYMLSGSRPGRLTRPSSPPSSAGGHGNSPAFHPPMTRVKTEPVIANTHLNPRDRSYSEDHIDVAPAFQFHISHPPSPSRHQLPGFDSTNPANAIASPISATSPSSTSLAPPTVAPLPLPRPSLISRASSAAREAEKMRAANSERHRKESGGSTTSSLSSSSSSKHNGVPRDTSESLSRRPSIANSQHRGFSGTAVTV